jgi:cation-transporting ATPase E
VLVILARPFTRWKGVLVGAMVGAVALILVVEPLRNFYALRTPEVRVLGEAALIAAGAILLLEIGWRASRVIGRRRAAMPDTAPSSASTSP